MSGCELKITEMVCLVVGERKREKRSGCQLSLPNDTQWKKKIGGRFKVGTRD